MIVLANHNNYLNCKILRNKSSVITILHNLYFGLTTLVDGHQFQVKLVTPIHLMFQKGSSPSLSTTPLHTISMKTREAQ